MVNEKKERFYSTTEAAELLGISRIAVFNRIKRGEIRARKVGKNYIIAEAELSSLIGRQLSKTDKRDISRAVRKAVKEYGQAFDLLGSE